MATEKLPVRKKENVDRKPEWLNRETYDAATTQIRSWPTWKQEMYAGLIRADRNPGK